MATVPYGLPTRPPAPAPVHRPGGMDRGRGGLLAVCGRTHRARPLCAAFLLNSTEVALVAHTLQDCHDRFYLSLISHQPRGGEGIRVGRSYTYRYLRSRVCVSCVRAYVCRVRACIWWSLILSADGLRGWRGCLSTTHTVTTSLAVVFSEAA